MPDNKVMIEVGVNAPDVVKKIQEITGANQKLQEQLDAIKLKNGETSQAYIRLNAELAIGKAKLGEYNSQLQAIYTSTDGSVQKLTGLKAQYEALKTALDNLSEAERNSPKGQELAGALGQVEVQIKATTATATEMKDMFTGAMTSIGESTDLVLSSFGNTEAAQNAQIAVTTALDATTKAYTIARGFANAADLAAALQAKTATAATKGWGLAIKANAAFTKINNAATAMASTVMRAFGVSVNMSGKAFKVLKGAIISTGVGALVVALGEVVSWLSSMGDETEESSDKLDTLRQAKQDFAEAAANSIAKERAEMSVLIDVAKDEHRSREDRLEAIKKINDISPKYLGNITLETVNTEKATKAIDAYNDSLARRAKAIAAQDLLVDLEKKLLTAEFNGASPMVLSYMRKYTEGARKTLIQTINDAKDDMVGITKTGTESVTKLGTKPAAVIKKVAQDTKDEVSKLVDTVIKKSGLGKMFELQDLQKQTNALKSDIDTIIGSLTNSTIKLSKEQENLKKNLEKEVVARGFNDLESFGKYIIESANDVLLNTVANTELFSLNPEQQKRELELFEKLTKEHTVDTQKIWLDYFAARNADQTLSLEQFLKNELAMQESIKRTAKEITNLTLDEQKNTGQLSPYASEDSNYDEIITKENNILGMKLSTRQKLWSDYWKYIKEGNEQTYNDWLNMLNKQANDKSQSLTNMVQMQADFLTSMSDLVAESITETGFDMERFSKGYLNLMLDMMQKILSMAIFNITAHSMSSIDSVATGGITGISKTAILSAVVNGAFTIAKALINKKSKSSFADGGIVNGPPHTQGGVKYYSPGGVVELEGGEAVINKNATARFLPLLSAINAAGGGVKFAQGGIIPAYNNAMVSQNIVNQNTGIDYTMLAKAIAQMPAPVVAVEDISSAQGRMVRIANRARI